MLRIFRGMFFFRDGLGIFHNPGVRHQNAGNVRPVFIDVCVQCSGGKGAGDIAAASRKGLDLAIGQLAIEAGNDDADAVYLIAQGLIAALLIHGAVKAEVDPVSGVHELKAQIIRHKPGREIFAPAGQFVLGDGFVVQLGLQSGKLRFQIDGEIQIPGNLPIPGGNHFKNPGAVHAVLGVGIAQVQQIRDLVVLLTPLSGGGDHNNLPLRVRQKDIPDLPILPGIRHGGAAEFDYFHI